MDVAKPLTRSWQEQLLPAPLIPYRLAETLALGLLRQQPDTRAAVAAGPVLVRQTLELAGIDLTPVLLQGPGQPAGPDYCFLSTHEGVARFDQMLTLGLTEPAEADSTSGTWLRERTLAAARLLALAAPDVFVQLPDVDAGWHPTQTVPTAQPRIARWMVQGAGLLVLGFAALDVYIWNAGRAPALWPLLAFPLLGSLLFGALLFRHLSTYRRRLAEAWLARPKQLRPDTVAVARRLAHRPWALLYQPVLLLLLAFGVIVFLLATAPHPSLTMMLGPVGAALLAQLGLAGWQIQRYLQRTREVVQGLSVDLLPAVNGPIGPWASYSYF